MNVKYDEDTHTLLILSSIIKMGVPDVCKNYLGVTQVSNSKSRDCIL